MINKHMWKIINPYKMALAVREGKVTNKEFIIYTFILVALSILDILFIVIIHVEDLLMRYIFYTLSVFGFFIPFTVAFVANHQGDGNRFISINIAIIFIVSFSALIISIFYVGIFLQPANDPSLFSWDDIFVVAAALVIGSIMSYGYMRIASSTTTNSSIQTQ